MLASPKPLFRDRDEEEVRGYREALCLIHETTASLILSEETICRLHRLTRGQIWDEGQHDPWPYINFTLSILKTAYQEFAERVGDIQAPRGSKTEMILAALQRLPPEFTVAQLEQACPGVSREMLRRVLGEQKGKSVDCIGRGPGAKWKKKEGNIP